MDYIIQEKDYWIHQDALSITLNALGGANRIQCSVVSGAVIRVFVENVDAEDTLGYNAAHSYKSWLLSVSPTFFSSDTEKYVYVAVPKTTTIGTRAIVVFPSELLDIYGKNAEDVQIGSTDYYYIYIYGHISAVETSGGHSQRRFITDPREHTGKLDTPQGDKEALMNTDWYHYSKVDGIVTFLKRIIMGPESWFQTLRLGSADNVLRDVAKSDSSDEYIDSDEMVATPGYVDSQYLSKTHESEAQEKVGFLKGLWIKANSLFGIDKEGNAIFNNTDVNILKAARGIIGKISSPNYHSGEMAGTGWQITDDAENGTSRLEVDTIVARMKFVASVLETRKYVSMGGNYVFSPAAGIIEQVDYIKDTEEGGQPKREVMGYSYEKVPWLVKLIPLRLRNVLLSRVRKTKHSVKRSEAEDMKNEATVFRCYLKADDGTTATINTWQVGMLVRCQTFDVEKSELGTHTDETFTGAVQNTYYWREIVAVGKGRMPIDDGYDHHYIDLSNETGHYYGLSDIPSPGDNIVCYGSTKKDTSHFIVIETVGADAPALKEYRGVGLVNIHRDNNTQADPPELPNFNFANCRRTMISPTSGNEFFAPRYYIETDDDTEQLYVEHYKGEAATFITRTSEIYPMPELGIDEVMLVQDRVLNKPKAYKVNASGRFEEISVRYGDIWYVQSNGKVYMAKAPEWEERGDYIVKDRFAQEIQGDTEMSIATKMGFIDPVSGEPEWENVGEYIRSSTENISRLTHTEKYGKNLLGAPLTGTGWTSGAGLPVSIIDNELRSSDKQILSPAKLLDKGTYVFSFYTGLLETDEEDRIKAVVQLVNNASSAVIETITIAYTGETRGAYYYRYKAVVTMAQQMNIRIGLDVSETSLTEARVYMPQLEYGDTATEFSVNSSEISSVIKQTADNIKLEVTNGLEATGIYIDGNNKRIDAKANQFTLSNAAGTDTLMGLDQYGDMTLKGTIYAQSVFKKVLFTSVSDQYYIDYDGSISRNDMVHILDDTQMSDVDAICSLPVGTYLRYGLTTGRYVEWTEELEDAYGLMSNITSHYEDYEISGNTIRVFAGERCAPPIDYIMLCDDNSTPAPQSQLGINIVAAPDFVGKLLEICNYSAYQGGVVINTSHYVKNGSVYQDEILYLVRMTNNGVTHVQGQYDTSYIIPYNGGGGTFSVTKVHLLATPAGWLVV